MIGRAARPTRRPFFLNGPPLVALAFSIVLAGIYATAWMISGIEGATLAGLGALAVLLGAKIAGSATERYVIDQSHEILEGISSAVIVIDLDGNIERANKAAETLFEDRSGTLVGSNIAAFMPPDLAARHGVSTRNFNGKNVAMNSAREVIARTRTGREFPAEVLISSISLDGRKRIVGVVNDTSWRKSAQARLDAANSDLQRLTAELDNFAYVASHDLKAPLRVIDNASQWIAEDLEPHLTQDTRESLDMLRGRVQRMEQLLDALLEHSRIGRVPPRSDVVRGDVLADAILARIEKPEGFSVSFDEVFLAERLPRSPLHVILAHLVDNAIRHHDRATGQVSVTLTLEAGQMVFRVRDDGPGIPEQYHKKIFEVFQTLVRRDEVDTTGMGLAIVQKHAQVAGGSVAIEPGSGRGTTVRLEWPFVSAPREVEVAAT